jgi:outer membrane receptor protein involved in Fe transport
LNVDYHGADISLNKRMSHGWSLMSGANFGRARGTVITGDLNNPNSPDFRTGAFGNDVPWSYRLSGVVDLPFHIAGSATSSYYAGFPELTTVTVNSRTVALTQASQSVIVSERGTTRFPSVFQLDASLRRPIRLRNMTLDPRIDFYNLTNESSVQRRVTVLGPAYTRPSDVQRGRLIKFGISAEF